MRFGVDYNIVFVVDYSDLSDIRSFDKYLLGFLRVGEWVRGDFGLDLMIFWDRVNGEF